MDIGKFDQLAEQIHAASEHGRKLRSDLLRQLCEAAGGAFVLDAKPDDSRPVIILDAWAASDSKGTWLFFGAPPLRQGDTCYPSVACTSEFARLPQRSPLAPESGCRECRVVIEFGEFGSCIEYPSRH